MNNDTTQPATVPCHRCTNGRIKDTRLAAITHKATAVRRKCRTCNGSGAITPVDTTAAVRAALWNQEIGEIPAWMLGDDEPTEPTPICFSNRVHPAHDQCAGFDADTLFDRTMDARS